MDEVACLKALLGRGYFPKELPNVFTTADLGAAATGVILEWKSEEVFKKETKTFKKKTGKSTKKVPKRDCYNYILPTPEAEIVSCPKRGHERRNIHITHPIPQALLSLEIAMGWSSIAKWLGRSRYSIETAQLSAAYPRAVRPINFEAHRAKKSYIEASADWIVKTDITRFYPSIYTHSIPWAAYGKEKIKANLETYKGTLADRLDQLVRSCNRNQTVGIPIGPETSRILADTISARIDDDFSGELAKLQAAAGNGKFKSKSASIGADQVDRLQDDWFVGSPSLDQSENALASIARCYRAYSLDINGSKTSVERITASSPDKWLSELGGFLSHTNEPFSRARLREFLNLTLRLQLDHPREPVIIYSLSVLESRRSKIPDIAALESFLIKSASIAPSALSRICSVLVNLQVGTGRGSVDRVRNRFTQLAERAVINEHTYELIWLLYTLRGLKASINSRKLVELSESSPSSALILLLLDMQHKGLMLNKLPKAHWEFRIDKDRVLTDWTWLYAYEGIRHGWLADAKKVMDEPFFATMKKRNLVFYDPRRNVEKTAVVVKRRVRQTRINKLFAQMLISDLRGFSAEDY